jgi:hypothetical protein
MRLFNLITPRPRKGSVRAHPVTLHFLIKEHMVKDNQAETIRIGTAGLLRAFLPSRALCNIAHIPLNCALARVPIFAREMAYYVAASLSAECNVWF